MSASSRDRISVDLRGMKAALLVRAQETGMTPSDLIRKAIAQLIDQATPAPCSQAPEPDQKGRVRFSVRMRHADARVIHDRAKAADLSVGDFIVGISAGSQTLLDSQRPIDLVRALIASSAELSTLSRDLRHLTALLSHGSIRAAQEYRERLEAVDADVRTHLKLAATLMADLRPLRLRQGTVAND